GVKVPKKGYENKVFYVWFDAPIGYISITQQLLGEKWKAWWKKPQEVLLYQFMAKDNIPFHTILFPATLIGSGDNYTLLYHIDSVEYLLYEGGKFSKSAKIGVFGDDAKNTGLPSDIFRFYLISIRPENSDSVFSWKELQEKVNNELVANLGNLVNRVVTFIANYLSGRVDEKSFDEEDLLFIEKVNRKEKEVIELLDNCELREGIKGILSISRFANQYFQQNEPWKAIKENPEKAKRTMFVLANVVKDIAILLYPYLPNASESIFKQLGIDKKNYSDLGRMSLKNNNIGVPKILFKKIEDDKIQELEEEFSGKNEEILQNVDLVVGKILSVEEHPNADRLYILEVDLGNEKRQIVAGLKKYFKKEELIGHNIIVVANLKPAKLKGVESNGMLLAAEKGGIVRLLTAKNSNPGDKVYVGFVKPQKEDYKHKKEITKKEITIEEFSKIKFDVKNKRVLYNKMPLRTESEELSVDIPDGALVR
ncbi:MAG: class I tRNA ligase family protein, partial [Candidatus Woesearchaeota archaeon]